MQVSQAVGASCGSLDRSLDGCSQPGGLVNPCLGLSMASHQASSPTNRGSKSSPTAEKRNSIAREAGKHVMEIGGVTALIKLLLEIGGDGESLRMVDVNGDWTEEGSLMLQIHLGDLSVAPFLCPGALQQAVISSLVHLCELEPNNVKEILAYPTALEHIRLLRRSLRTVMTHEQFHQPSNFPAELLDVSNWPKGECPIPQAFNCEPIEALSDSLVSPP